MPAVHLALSEAHMADDDRLLVIVSYDVSEPRTLNRIRRNISSFAIGGQKSFYECWVTPVELEHLAEKINQLLNKETDRIHIFELHENEYALFLGEARRQSIEPFLVV